MTAHQLAAILMAGPDIKVLVSADADGCEYQELDVVLEPFIVKPIHHPMRQEPHYITADNGEQAIIL